MSKTGVTGALDRAWDAGAVAQPAAEHAAQPAAEPAAQPAAEPAGTPAPLSYAGPPVPTTAPKLPLACDRLLAWADRRRWWLFGGLVLLYAAGFTGRWRPEPDSALYMSVARSLAGGEGYTYHGLPHRLVYPGFPWLLAVVFGLFGSPGTGPAAADLIAAHLTVLVTGLLSLALTYRLFLLHAGRPTAVLVTVLVGISRTFYRYNYEIRSDLPYLLAVLAFLVGYEAVAHWAGRRARAAVESPPGETPETRPAEAARGRPRVSDWLLLPVGLAAAIVTRPAMVALLLAIVAAAVWSILTLRGRGRRWRVAGLLAVVAAATTFYLLDPRRSPDGGTGHYESVLLDPQRWGPLLDKALNENLPKVFHPTVSEAVMGMDVAPPVNVVLSVALLASFLVLFRAHVLWGLLAGTTLLTMAIEAQPRYLLAVLPLLMYAVWRSLAWLNRRVPGRRGDRLFAGLFALVVALNLLRTAQFAVEQRRVDADLRHYRRGDFAGLYDLGQVVRENTGPGAWVLVRDRLGRILTYVSGRYGVEPDPATELNPAVQPVYVLEPLDQKAQDWMAERRIGTGPLVTEFDPGAGREPWRLYRAVRLPDPPPGGQSVPEPASP